MGKGDLKTKRGKIVAKTFGVARPKKQKNKLSNPDKLHEMQQNQEG